MKVLSNTHKGGVVQCLLVEKSHHIGDQHDWKNPRQKSLVRVQKKCLFFQTTHIKSIFRTSFFSALAENWNEDSRAQFSTLWPSSFSPYSGSFLIESFDILKRARRKKNLSIEGELNKCLVRQQPDYLCERHGSHVVYIALIQR